MLVPLHTFPLRSLTSRSRSSWYPSAAIEQFQRPMRQHRAFLFNPRACDGFLNHSNRVATVAKRRRLAAGGAAATVIGRG